MVSNSAAGTLAILGAVARSFSLRIDASSACFDFCVLPLAGGAKQKSISLASIGGIVRTIGVEAAAPHIGEGGRTPVECIARALLPRLRSAAVYEET